MGQLQYIGARYVPVWYVNTDDQTANWQINVEYEPLTFVTTVNNHLYLSKKTVPDNIGNPANNTEYWLDMGSFTGSFQDLQDQINQLSDDLTALDTRLSDDVTTLQTALSGVKAITDKITPNSLIGKQIAVYGDSWADDNNVYSAWIDELSTYSGNTVHNHSFSGWGFNDIDTSFDNYVADVYIIEAGINNWNSNTTPNDVKTYINSIISKIRAVAPDADIMFTTPIAGLRQQPNYPNVHTYYPLEVYRQIIWNCAIQAHCMVASGLKMSDVFVGDGLHPTAASCKNIAKAIIKSYEAGGDSRDYNTEFAWIDSSNTIYCLADAGSFHLVGNRTVSFNSGNAALANNYYNLSKCFLNRPQISLSGIVASDTFITETGLNANGLSFRSTRVSTGNPAGVNGDLAVHFDIPVEFYGTMDTTSVSNP